MDKITVPALIMPNVIVCFYLYIFTDSENDAFHLAYPVW